MEAQTGHRKQLINLLRKMDLQHLLSLLQMVQQLHGDINLLHHLDHFQVAIQLSLQAQQLTVQQL